MSTTTVTEEPTPPKAIEPQKTKILIVDDSPTDTYVARKVAEQLFDEVRNVHSVQDMFAELKTFRPDICTMDINLSDHLNGISLVAELRASDDDLSVMPIVMLSSRQTPADKQIAENAGASDYIVKPVTVEALHEIACKLIPGFKRVPFMKVVS